MGRFTPRRGSNQKSIDRSGKRLTYRLKDDRPGQPPPPEAIEKPP